MKKNFSINDDKIKVNFMITKELNEKIKLKARAFKPRVCILYNN